MYRSLKLLFIVIVFLFFFVIFGPFVGIKYKSCMNHQDIIIRDDIRIFELKFKDSKDLQKYTRYDYDAPLLCIDTNRSKMCTKDFLNIELEKIDTKKLTFTGTVFKQYSFNAFVSDSSKMKVIVNDKRYWISPYDYLELFPFEKQMKMNPYKDIIKSFCMFNKVRDFQIKY